MSGVWRLTSESRLEHQFPLKAMQFCLVETLPSFVHCQQRLGQLCLQHLSNVLMVLLPRALQERLIGGVLDQGMFEEIRRLGRHPPLVEEFGLDQLPERVLHRQLIPGGYCL
jgi:hypothetical protein